MEKKGKTVEKKGKTVEKKGKTVEKKGKIVEKKGKIVEKKGKIMEKIIEKSIIEKSIESESPKATKAKMEGTTEILKKNILFICTHNSARSQMAEGLMDHLYGDRYNSFSAGTEPAGVNPNAIQAMSEMGVDISPHRSKSVDDFLEMNLDYVVTVCDNANETCPFFPGGKVRMHKSFRDPSLTQGTSEEILEAFRRSRDEIREWLTENFG